jgi:glucose-6-phosphate 1-dehydrogenase
MVLFGASGDLTSRLLMPGVTELAEAGLLPAGMEVLGSSLTEWSTEEFRQHIAAELERHSAATAVTRDRVLGMLSYRPSNVVEADDVRKVIGDDHPPTLVYLALPPGLLPAALKALSACQLQGADAVAIEKPFGTDLASAKDLNEIIRIQLPQPTMFRVDHFLSSELVRRVMALRFLNRVFEPTLNAVQVERVDISWLESLTLEGRASYYDTAGALKDMVQNHLMEVMALLIMEQPARLDSESFGGNRVEALRAVVTPSLEHIKAHTIRARYSAGSIGSRSVPSYLDEPGVDPGRGTETYASLTLDVAKTQWEGVPFTLHSGKAMPADSAEIAVHFRPVLRHLLQQWPGVEPNVLRIGLSEPYVRLGAAITRPGAPAGTRELELQTESPLRTPYANLLLEMLGHDPTLFIRGDEAEEAWRIIDPVVDAWSRDDVPMQEYEAGKAPPVTSP